MGYFSDPHGRITALTPAYLWVEFCCPGEKEKVGMIRFLRFHEQASGLGTRVIAFED